jgi:hypothetical protein
VLKVLRVFKVHKVLRVFKVPKAIAASQVHRVQPVLPVQLPIRFYRTIPYVL